MRILGTSLLAATLLAQSPAIAQTAPIFLHCTGKSFDANGTFTPDFDITIKVFNETLAYWNADGNRFVDNCFQMQITCQVRVTESEIRMVRMMPAMRPGETSRNTISISRYTGSYSSNLAIIDAQQKARPNSAEAGTCEVVQSPEGAQRKF